MRPTAPTAREGRIHRRALTAPVRQRRLQWFQPLRRNLPLLISALLFTVVGAFGWLANDRVYDTVESAAVDRLSSAGQRIAGLLGESTAQFVREINAVAREPAVRAAVADDVGRRSPELLEALGAAMGTGRTVSVALWTRDCTLVASTGPADGLARCPQASPAGVAGAAVGNFVARGDSVDYPTATAVVAASGDTLGYVVAVRTLTGSGAEPIAGLIGPGVSVLVGNASGTLWTDLVRPVPGPRTLPPVGDPVVVADDAGVRHLSMAVPVARTSWVVLVRVPHRMVVAPARALLVSMVTAGLLCIGIGAIGAYFISRRVTRPIGEITSAAARIAAGDYSQRVPVHGSDELGHLASVFNVMVAQVDAATNDLHTQAMELEEQVQESKHARRDTAVVRSLLDDVLASSPVGIAVLDPQLCYVKANPAMAAMNRYPAEAHLGNTPAQVDPVAGSLLEPLLIQARAEGVTLANRRLAITDAEGTRHWLATVFPVRDFGGEVSSVGVVVLDTTAHQELEAQFLQAQKMEAIGRLAGGVAHDFNNILTVILSYSSMAVETLAEGDELRGDMEEVRDAATRAAGLTRQLLAFSRNQVMQSQVLDLNEIARGMERMLQRLLGEDVELVLDLAPGLHDIDADPGQMEQVLMNLAVNARDSMPHGGRLEIATSNDVVTGEYSATLGTAEGDCVLLTVSDTGHGMTEATQARMFEPFFTTKPEGKGTGLGLSTVYGIVHQSGGSIAVTSRPGEGATFRIRLPCSIAEVHKRRLVTPPRTPMRGTETILLVEDDPSLRALAQRVLTQAGYRVLEAPSSEAAVALGCTFDGPIDLLLTDVVMPGHGGREVAEALRTRRPGMLVLYMSGYTDDELVRRGVVAASVRLLQKPFTPQRLAQCVRDALGLGREAVEASAETRVG